MIRREIKTVFITSAILGFIVFGVLLAGSGNFLNAAVTLSQDIVVGSGTADVTVNGDDVYITGTLEVDGAVRLDGTVALNGALTASSGITATTTLTINNTSSGDPYLSLQDAGTEIYKIGVDNSDRDIFRIIPLNGAFSATTSGMTILPSGFVGIGTTNPSTALEVNGTITVTSCTGCGGAFSSASGLTTLSTITDLVGIGDASPKYKLTVSSGYASTTLAINNGGTGDSILSFQTATTTRFMLGVDNSDSDVFRLAPAGAMADVFSATSTGITVNTVGNVGIGTTNPNSTLHVEGSLALSQATITATTTLDDTHNVILANATGNITVNLPAAASHTDKTYYIKKIDADADEVTIDGNASETIDGATTLVLYVQYDAVRIISDGSNWHVIDDELRPHMARLTRESTGQSLTQDTLTRIEFDTETYDVGGIAAADGTGGSDDEVTIKRAGKYRVSTTLWVWDLDDNEAAQLFLRLNGVSIMASVDRSAWAASNVSVEITDTFDFNEGDIITMWVQQYGDTNWVSQTANIYSPKMSVVEMR
jgi:Cu/Ag efflux protein CusF